MHYNWTEDKLATLRKMAKERASAVAIARELGGISAKAVRRKTKALGLDAKPKWPSEKIEILRDSYRKGISITRIAELLGPGYSRESICVKASQLGITQRARWTAEQEHIFDYYYSTGLQQKDLLHQMSEYPDGQVRYRIMKKHEQFAALSFEQRNAARKEAVTIVTSMLGHTSHNGAPSHGVYVAAWLAAITRKTGRDLREIAQIALLPIPYVEKVFAELDNAGIWPGTQMAMPDLTAEDYENIAQIANDHIAYFMGYETYWLSYAMNN